VVKIGNLELGNFPLILAPMEDVSDPPFRALCKKQGADLMFTEFISSEGLIRHAIKSVKKLDIFEYERPIGIQIFGGEIESMIRAAEMAEAVNPDIIDINYGCPVKKVVCKEAGAGILKNIPKMVAMTAEIVKSTRLPVTVKTRLGWDDNSKHIVEVAERLQDVGIQGLTIHGRTRVQMYKGVADWSLISEVKNNPRMRIPIFGNGDINTPQKALEYKNKFGVDGIMIGRATIGYPWFFREVKHFMATGKLLAPPTVEERVQVCREHLQMAMQWKGEKLGLIETRTHYGNYFRGLPNFKDFRIKLVTSDNAGEVFETLEAIQNYYTRHGELLPA
jgi:nifR3 family TIM-barrel protein